jgi:streptogramin lyase
MVGLTRRGALSWVLATLAFCGLAFGALAACDGAGDGGARTSPTQTTTAATTLATTVAATTTTLAAGPVDQEGTIAQTSPVGSNGIVATAERLYVADLRGSQVVAIDPSSGRITARWGAAEGVAGPDDVALGPDGSLYFTSFTTGAVGRISPDGTVTEVANIGVGANPIAFSDDGRLFAGRAVGADGLFEVDPTGAVEPRNIAETLGNVNAFAIGDDGALYGPLFGLAGEGAVVRVDVDTGDVRVVAKGLGYPVSVRFNPSGELLVAHLDPPSILRLVEATGTFESIAEIPHAIDNFATAPDGRLFVTSFNSAKVTEVGIDGKLRTFTLGRP